MDHSTWCGDRRFRLNGRRDGAVQVGGVNVFPEHVRDTLLLHDNVADAAVRFDPSSARLKAFVVPRRGEREAALADQIDQWCCKHLADVERPRHFTLGHEVPRDPMGKLANW